MMRRQQLRQALRHIYDIERLLGRVACGTANARHLTALALPWQGWRQYAPLWRAARQRCCGLRDDCSGEDEIVALLTRAIVDEPPPTIRDGGLIRPGYDTTLDDLIHETSAIHAGWRACKSGSVNALALNP